MANSYVAFGLGAACIATSLPQVLGLSWYKKSMASYEGGQEKPIANNIKKLIDKVLVKVKINEEDLSHIEFFSCFDNNPVNRGEVNLKSGAIIGLPPTFSYRSTSDIDRDKLTVGAEQKCINWDSEAGNDLQDAMVLSENAKSFAIAREVFSVQSWHTYAEVTLKMGIFSLGYTVVYHMESLLQLRHRASRFARYGVYSIIGSVFLFMYLTASDTYSCHRDYKSDFKAASISEEFANGGLEFYEKCLKRNVALRTLLGKDGAKIYTPYGNEVSMWRTRHLQYTARRDLLKKHIMDNYKNKDDTLASVD